MQHAHARAHPKMAGGLCGLHLSDGLLAACSGHLPLLHPHHCQDAHGGPEGWLAATQTFGAQDHPHGHDGGDGLRHLLDALLHRATGQCLCRAG